MEKLFEIHVCEHQVSRRTGHHFGGRPSDPAGLPRLEFASLEWCLDSGLHLVSSRGFSSSHVLFGEFSLEKSLFRLFLQLSHTEQSREKVNSW